MKPKSIYKNFIAATFFVVLSNLNAADLRFGSWVLDERSNGTGEAHTQNESGSSLGVICLKECFAYVDPKISCTNGQNYPILFSSQMGVGTRLSTCLHVGDRMVLKFDELDFITANAAKQGLLGFSIGMKDAQFKVVKFDMDGAATSIGGLLASVQANNKRTVDKIY